MSFNLSLCKPGQKVQTASGVVGYFYSCISDDSFYPILILFTDPHPVKRKYTNGGSWLGTIAHPYNIVEIHPFNPSDPAVIEEVLMTYKINYIWGPKS